MWWRSSCSHSFLLWGAIDDTLSTTFKPHHHIHRHHHYPGNPLHCLPQDCPLVGSSVCKWLGLPTLLVEHSESHYQHHHHCSSMSQSFPSDPQSSKYFHFFQNDQNLKILILSVWHTTERIPKNANIATITLIVHLYWWCTHTQADSIWWTFCAASSRWTFLLQMNFSSPDELLEYACGGFCCHQLYCSLQSCKSGTKGYHSNDWCHKWWWDIDNCDIDDGDNLL